MKLYNIVCECERLIHIAVVPKVRDVQDELFAASPEDALEKFKNRWQHKYTVRKMVMCEPLTGKSA